VKRSKHLVPSLSLRIVRILNLEPPNCHSSAFFIASTKVSTNTKFTFPVSCEASGFLSGITSSCPDPNDRMNPYP